MPLLSGVIVGDVRRDPAAAERGHTVLSALTIWRSEGVLVLGETQLSRSVRIVRGERHLVQSRITPAWRDFRDPQNNAGGGTYQGRRPGQPVHGESGCGARLGVCTRVRRRNVADAASSRT